MSPEQTSTSADSAPKRRSTKAVVAIVAVVIVVAVIGGFVLMVSKGWTGVVRDIFIILMAIVSLFIGVMIVMLVYQIAALTRMLREEIKPLLESTQETVNTARGTTRFVSEHVVRPAISAAGTMAGIARVVSLLGDLFLARK